MYTSIIELIPLFKNRSVNKIQILNSEKFVMLTNNYIKTFIDILEIWVTNIFEIIIGYAAILMSVDRSL